VSGPNEHFLPRLIQRGFLIEQPGEWTFLSTRTGTWPKRIKWVGSGHYFNSGSESGKTVDDALGGFENSIGNHVAKWRSSSGESIDANLASATVMHMAIRSKHIRESIFEIGEKALDINFLNFLDKRWLSKRMLNAVRDSDSDIMKELRRNLIQKGYLGEALLQAEGYAIAVVSDSINSFVEKSISIFKENYPILYQSIATAVPDAHRQILSKEHDGKRLDFLRKLDWKIARFPDREFIFPDCGVIAVPKSGPSGPLFFWDRDAPHAVVMPISNNNLMIGVNVSYIKPEIINKQLAECSTEFFISKKENSIDGLRSLIGRAADKFRERMDKALLSQII
jgi:hypothetical protein